MQWFTPSDSLVMPNTHQQNLPLWIFVSLIFKFPNHSIALKWGAAVWFGGGGCYFDLDCLRVFDKTLDDAAMEKSKLETQSLEMLIK